MSSKSDSKIWGGIISAVIVMVAILFVGLGYYNINNSINNYNKQAKQFYDKPYNVSLALVPSSWDDKLEGYMVDDKLNKIKFDKCTMRDDRNMSYAGCLTFDGKYNVTLNHFKGGKAFNFDGITLTVRQNDKTTIINNYKTYESADRYLLMRNNDGR